METQGDDTRGSERPAHSILLGAEVLIVEHMCNLGQLPDEGFTFTGLPLWLALRDGHLVGYQLFIPAQSGHGTADMLISEQYSYLALAATREEEQGRGVARAITAHGLAIDHSAGYTHCTIDWRATNLLSSRFWPGRDSARSPIDSHAGLTSASSGHTDSHLLRPGSLRTVE